jgi:hypothetical protein
MRLAFLHEASLAGYCLDDTGAFKLGICFRNRVPVDAQFFGERPDARQRLSGLQCARSGGCLDLIDRLKVDRLAGLLIDLEKESGPTVIRQ